jgi:predicted metal-dependent peptidase
MKVKIKDVKKLVYSGDGKGSGPQPPEIERPPNIEGIKDDEENKSKDTPMPGDQSEDSEQNDQEQSKSQEGQSSKDSENDQKDENDGEGSSEELSEDDFKEEPSEGESKESSKEQEESEDSKDAKEKARKTFEEIEKELGKIDEHIEDASEIPDNIVEAPEDDEDAGSFKPNNPKDVNEDQTNTIVDEAKEIQQRTEEKTTGRGQGGGGFSSLGADIVNVSTNWQQALAEFFQENVKNVYTYMRPDRRLLQQGIVMRTKRQEFEERLDLVIAVDTSGSISRPLFNTFISEIINIIDTFDKLKFKLLLFHDNVYGEVNVNIDPERQYDFDEDTPEGIGNVDYRSVTDKEDAKNEFRNLFLYQSGGTNLSSIKEYLDKRGIEEIDGLLVFTDGDTESNPSLPNFKNILFMINKGGNTSIVSKFGPVEIVDIPHSRKGK